MHEAAEVPVANKVTILQIEEAIARCEHAHPNENARLHPETSKLSEVYGLMIFYKASEIDLAEFSPEIQEAVRQWVAS